jgi:hypothetical protein
MTGGLIDAGGVGIREQFQFHRNAKGTDRPVPSVAGLLELMRRCTSKTLPMRQELRPCGVACGGMDQHKRQLRSLDHFFVEWSIFIVSKTPIRRMHCGVILICPLRQPGRHRPVWVRRVSQFRLSAFTTFQTGVPLVSIDRKGSACLPSSWEMSRIVRRLRTPDCAAIGRTLRTLRIITHMRLSMSNTSYR